MGKRWTEDEDRFLIAYFDSVGPFIGPHDLGRSEASVAARARALKASGAWAAHQEADLWRKYALILADSIRPNNTSEWDADLREIRERGWRLPEKWHARMTAPDTLAER